jgi:hypothetical protein
MLADFSRVSHPLGGSLFRLEQLRAQPCSSASMAALFSASFFLNHKFAISEH